MPRRNTQRRIKPSKVERHCPRCRRHAYHWGNVKGVRHQIECCNCGHTWTGRVRDDETIFVEGDEA